jgi:hypothetical protein
MSLAVRAFARLLALALAACGGGSEASPDAGGDLEPPPGCALGAPPAGWTYPAGPYGTDVDDTFENLVLDDCDGAQVNVGDVLAQAQLLLVSVGAGWCEPCIEESETLDAEIFRAYCPRGLRVVQILFQDDQSRPATGLFCQEWKQRYAMSFPVLRDPLFETQRFFTDITAQTPVNLLVDPDGAIVYKEVGTPAADLPQRLDGLLPP